MSAGRPLFQLRKELNSSIAQLENDDLVDSSSSMVNETHTSEYLTSAIDTSLEHHQNQGKFNNVKVLTENDKYVVKRLTPDLSSLPLNEEYLEGTVDVFLGKALVNDADHLYIWDYQSTQRNVNFSRVPLHEESEVLSSPPKCLFTRPSAVDDSTQMFLDNSAGSSGGICIIHRKNGQFIYYEDIDSINNLHLQLSKNKAHTLQLNLKDDEVVKQAINCEPAGIVITTSHERLLFIAIRDSTGRPHVKVKQQLIKSQRGFFFHSLNAYKEIVSLKNGPIVGRGERLLYMITRGGDLQTWQLSVGSHSFKRVEINIYEQILESLQDLYPFAHGSLQILSSHPLFSDTSSAHLILSSIQNDKETYYILSTILLDEKTNSFTIFSTYRLNTYVSPCGDNKPKLYIPDYLGTEVRHMTTVFVLFSDAVVLTQVSSNLDSTYPLRRKWEDIVSFRDDVNVIGSGYSSDSVYLIDKKIGVMEVSLIEREKSEAEEDVGFVKSHIDQAIYFSDLSPSPIEFNLPKELSLENDEVEDDLKLASDEIFFSSGKYIPPMLNTLVQHLSLRVELHAKLLKFVEENFNYRISPQAKLDLLERFEIMNCCLKLFGSLEGSSELTEVWNSVLSSTKGNLDMEILVRNHLDKFPQIFANFLAKLTNESLSSRSLAFKGAAIDLLDNCVYEATLEQGEKSIRYGELKLDPLEISRDLPWFVSLEGLKAINDLFFDFKFSLASPTEHDKERIVVLTKILYYCFSQAKLWFKEGENREKLQLHQKIEDMYRENHVNWVHVLFEFGLQEFSLQIADFYHDMESLVETLEQLDVDESQETYSQYFNKFGYDFAKTLFNYYIEQGKLRDLFNRFPEQHELLVKFLNSSKQYGYVSWIQEILDEQYSKASETLVQVAAGKAGIDKPIDDRQFQLSIAKLTALAEDNSLDHESTINKIQSDLDIIDGQNDLAQRINEQGIKVAPRFLETELNNVFNQVAQKLKNRQSITLDLIVEIYTMLNNTECLYCALKLLAYEYGILDSETKKILISMVWRRCILAEADWAAVADLTQTAFYQVLCQYFDEELYRSGSPLPSYQLMCDKSVLIKGYLTSKYQQYTDNLDDIEGCFKNELKAVEGLGKIFETRVKSIIGSANESSGNRCAVNYESSIVEFH